MSLLVPISELTLNVSSTQLGSPAVASNGDDTLVAVWEGLPTVGDQSILGAVFKKNAAGTALTRLSPAQDVPLTQSTFGPQVQPAVAMNALGRICLAWNDLSGGPAGSIRLAVFDKDFSSQPFGPEIFLPSDVGSTSQFEPHVAFSNTSDEKFACTWLETSPDGIIIVRIAILSLVVDLGGGPVPGINLINTFTLNLGTTGNPSGTDAMVAADVSTGEFYVAWASVAEDSGNTLIRCQKVLDSGPVGGAGAPLGGGSFIVNDNTTSASLPKIAVRTGTSEFVVIWHQVDSTELSGDIFNPFWRKLRYVDNAVESMIDPFPGIQPVGPAPDGTSVKATDAGDLLSFGDGDFIVSWIDKGPPAKKSIFCTQYKWDDLPLPYDSDNFTLQNSGIAPHKGVKCNLVDPGVQTFGPLVVQLGTNLGVVALTDPESIIGRIVRTTDRFVAGDLYTPFNSPHVYGVNGVDSISLDILKNAYFLEKGAGFEDVTHPPRSSSVTDLDAFLNGEDVVLVGGPLANSMSDSLMSSVNGTLRASISDTEVVEISYTTVGDGTLFLAAAPQLQIKNQKDLLGDFTLSRHQIPVNRIMDYAIIFQLKGTTNRLAFVGGIRDHGTGLACYVLDSVRRGPGAPPPVGQPPVSPDILANWTSLLNSNKAVVVRFTYALASNLLSTATVIANIVPSDIVLVPAQSIGADEP